ncbi:bro [Matsumuraeses phaseoli granulovirus]|uniref:Bro n=1 Tax=Matsumuraeses phaseoli granulovirus TaxID=2760664 RepID=A0AAE7MLA8_9BBAC|nr:bro [Matsumuraeses phaseoli granulovirus]QOD39989.1 bro [Matsumuraeses phaseoli granulovirus]
MSLSNLQINDTMKITTNEKPKSGVCELYKNKPPSVDKVWNYKTLLPTSCGEENINVTTMTLQHQNPHEHTEAIMIKLKTDLLKKDKMLSHRASEIRSLNAAFKNADDKLNNLEEVNKLLNKNLCVANDKLITYSEALVSSNKNLMEVNINMTRLATRMFDMVQDVVNPQKTTTSEL